MTDVRVAGTEYLGPQAAKRRTGYRREAYTLPYFDWNGERIAFERVRFLDPPTLKGKPQRYWQPPDSPCPFYFAPNFDWLKVKRDASKPLLLTEGERKALKACKHGFATIGLGGVWNFTREGLEEFAREFDLNGRVVYLVYDSDAVSNAQVQRAEARLAGELEKLGAHVVVVRLPAGKGEGRAQ